MASLGPGAWTVPLVVHAYREVRDGEEIIRKLSARAVIKMKSGDINNRKWTKSEIAAVDRIAAAQAVGQDPGIDYSDIPKFTPEQLAEMVRFRDVRRKVPVSVRLDAEVLE